MKLFEQKLVFFGGKGGVGKTTCAVAYALHAAKQNKKTIIVSTDPAHSLSDSLDKPVSGQITSVGENLDALEIDAQALMSTFKKEHNDVIRKIVDEGTYFRKQEIQRFLDLSLPGMDEWMAFLEISRILEEKKYDVVVVDTAPTGHTLRLLDVLMFIQRVIGVFTQMRQKHRVVVSMLVGKRVKDQADEFIEDLHSRVTRMQKWLVDSTRTCFVPVTIAESMAVEETTDLLHALKAKGMAVGMVLVNGVRGTHCSFCTKQRARQQEHLDEIRKRFSDYAIQEIPLFPYEVQGTRLTAFCEALFDAPTNARLSQPVLDSILPAFEKLSVLPDTNFLLFGGKGGVGKTTCAAATALHLAKEKKVLIVSTDPAHSLSDCFGKPIGNQVTRIHENVDALEIDAKSMWETFRGEYKTQVNSFFNAAFKSSGISMDAPYDRRIMHHLFDLGPPALDEVMALKVLLDLEEDARYDVIILDTAPTGHALLLLEMPDLAKSWIAALLDLQGQYPLSMDVVESLSDVRDGIERLQALLTDAKKTEFIVVAIAQSMVVSETRDLITQLKKLNIPVNHGIVNKVQPQNPCVFCSTLRAEQKIHVNALNEMGLNWAGVPLLEDLDSRASLKTIGHHLF